MTIKYFLKKIKDVKFADCLSILSLIIAKMLKPLYIRKYKNCWVICETSVEARDNGYHFFKYVRNNYPERKCFYAIKKTSPDYKKVSTFGNIIEYGSIKHWILYLCAEYNISSQKGGKPNTALCSFLELSGFIDSKLVFLQHGVIINDIEWLHSDMCQLRYFVTSTLPEYNFVRKKFGYNENQILLTGLARFDNLHNFSVNKKLILIMPTWRGRYTMKSMRIRSDSSFTDSQYKACWEELINHPKLIQLAKENDLEIMFFLHRDMQPFVSEFTIKNEQIIVARWEMYDIQEVLKSAALLITDYSSVFFDMVYMKKPVIFYQFDYDEFRKYDYRNGYFNYKDNGFARSYKNAECVIRCLEDCINHDYMIDNRYLQWFKKYFPFYDTNNCSRIYDKLVNRESNA